MKNGSSNYTNNKKSFTLTCHIDASNSLHGESDEQIINFANVYGIKPMANIPEVIATDSKLKKDQLSKECYDGAKTK